VGEQRGHGDKVEPTGRLLVYSLSMQRNKFQTMRDLSPTSAPASEYASGVGALLRDRPMADREAVLKGVFAAMSEGVVIRGQGGEILEANAAALAILGLSLDELTGRTSLDSRWQTVREDGTAFPGAEHPAMVTLRTGQPVREQIMGVDDPQRGLRWLSINSNPIWGDDGTSPTGVVTTFVDITEKKAMEARLAENAAELQDLYDNAPCAYHSLDASGTFIRINATALRWLGRTADEVIGKATPADFRDDEGKLQFQRVFAELKANGAVHGVEADVQTANGTTRRLSLCATAITDADGRFVKSRTVAYDISELHRARERLKAVSREQAAMLESDLIAIAKVRERHFVWANAGVTRILGYSPSEITGQSTHVLYASEQDYLMVGEAVAANRELGKHIRMQLEMRHKNGDLIWIDMGSVLLSQETGESMTILVDITASKRAEARQLELVRLEAQNQQVCETTHLKSAFIANMSHELRTPLNAVTGYAHLLRQGAIGPDSPKFKHYLSQIETSGRYLGQLIEGVLDFAKLESGKLEIHPTPIDLHSIVQEVVDLLELNISRKQLAISIDIDPELGELVADPMRVKQLVANYISNAVKFTAERGQVSVRATLHGADFFRVEVEDDGIGIAGADQARLFTPFEQLSSGSTKLYQGMGLGLALSRLLAEAHGGRVGVRSQLGVGSVFHFDLPRVQGKVTPMTPLARTE
jgi:PAS domain S-box-containing protein